MDKFTSRIRIIRREKGSPFARDAAANAAKRLKYLLTHQPCADVQIERIELTRVKSFQRDSPHHGIVGAKIHRRNV